MKKLLMLAALVSGVTVFGLTDTAKADHGSFGPSYSYGGYGCNQGGGYGYGGGYGGWGGYGGGYGYRGGWGGYGSGITYSSPGFSIRFGLGGSGYGGHHYHGGHGFGGHRH